MWILVKKIIMEAVATFYAMIATHISRSVCNRHLIQSCPCATVWYMLRQSNMKVTVSTFKVPLVLTLVQKGKETRWYTCLTTRGRYVIVFGIVWRCQSQIDFFSLRLGAFSLHIQVWDAVILYLVIWMLLGKGSLSHKYVVFCSRVLLTCTSKFGMTTVVVSLMLAELGI